MTGVNLALSVFAFSDYLSADVLPANNERKKNSFRQIQRPPNPLNGEETKKNSGSQIADEFSSVAWELEYRVISQSFCLYAKGDGYGRKKA